MKMEAPASNMLCSDENTNNLERLLNIFGSVVSLEDIASAYHLAGCNVHVAGEMLYNMQGSSSGYSTSESKDELDGNMVSKQPHVEGYSSAPKARKCSASMGTVSGVIGSQYARSKSSSHEACEVPKPLKLVSSEFPESEIWEEKHPSDNVEILHDNTEKFLFAMLGNGFQLEMNVIREVLGACGYNVEKSMEKLLDMSASTLEMGDNACNIKPKGKGKETLQCQETSQDRDFVPSGEADDKKGLELRKRTTDRHDLQKEVLHSLFTVPDRVEEVPRKIFPRKGVLRANTYGKFVIGPLKDTISECETPTAKLEAIKIENEDSGDDYDILRKAVKEHWITMKEYYKAAAEAYAKGNTELSNKCLEKGHFFMNKAREANEKSAQKLVEASNSGEIMSLDLHDHSPKEATRLLKLHLTSLSGIPSIQYLKLIVGVSEQNTKEGTRKQRIKKLLERESITWTEEGNGEIMMIQVDEINPKRLSFTTKPSTDYLLQEYL